MIRLDRDLCILDTETLGLHPDAPVWEVAAVRLDRETGQPTASFSMLVGHNRYRADGTDWADDLPEQFRRDYIARYWAEFAIRPDQAAEIIAAVTDGAIIAGSNPAFDMERLAKLLHNNGITPTWHYHPLDIPSMALGHLTGAYDTGHAEFRSEQLSNAIGVNPAQYERHTAHGDVAWCLAQWRAMNGQEETR